VGGGQIADNERRRMSERQRQHVEDQLLDRKVAAEHCLMNMQTMMTNMQQQQQQPPQPVGNIT